MGQGQEKRADATIIDLAEKGGWVFLQNNVPEGLLQSCINIANEPPQDLKANMTRAWGSFNEKRLAGSVKPVVFKACLFGLCFFHSVMLGRRRFGFQGWSRAYGFNMGDLRICADVLESYIKDTKNIPFQDIRYIFGEIMYGGHITDFFDRRTNNTYLSCIFNDALLNRGDLAPGLASPDSAAYNFSTYMTLIEKQLPAESPPIYGLHPNAEVGFLTNKAEMMFETILRIEIGAASSSSGVSSALRETLADLTRRCPPKSDLIELGDRVKLRVEDPDGPYCVVVAQECTQLQKGLNGQLNMSQGMEDMGLALDINQRLAWASRKTLLTAVKQLAATNAVYPEDGVFVHGLLLEGARWTDEEESSEDVKLKVLLEPLPLMYVKASVGYLRRDPSLYECPVYLTSARGFTFVFLSTLKTVDPVHKWVLAGVAILMQSDE
eukprot:GSChrysophyteH1.ASY1.ANO1.630.1 assembled CDS